MSATSDVELIQRILKGYAPELDVDGFVGKRTLAALDHLGAVADRERAPSVPESTAGHAVKATSFADPADVAAFLKCKSEGHSDSVCFARGDNGIGKWGHHCAQDATPMAALPREDWQQAQKTGGAKLAVTWKGKRVEGILGDTMPSRANIRNGAGIDLNPAYAKAFGVSPPFMLEGVTWEWV